MKNPNESNYTLPHSYQFDDRADVTHDPKSGLEGKGPNSDPASIFGGHWFCQYYDANFDVNGKKTKTTFLYDPSYGGKAYSEGGDAPGNVMNATQASLGRQLTSAVVAGNAIFAKVTLMDGTMTFALLIRKP